ncbi:MAG: sugar transferase, partial [Elainellaceae cyanobacterium]
MYMTESTVLLKTPTVLRMLLGGTVSTGLEDSSIVWEEETLIITPKHKTSRASMPALQSQAWLQDCLKRSPIQKVLLDPTLAESTIKSWADICEKTGKQVYLKVPATPALPHVKKPGLWYVKRVADWLTALV